VTRTRLQWVAFAVPPLLRLLQTTVLARFVGPHVLGVLFAALVVVNTLPRLIDVGLPHAAGYFLRRDAGLRPMILLLSLGSGVVGGVIALVVFFFGARLFPFADQETNVLFESLLPLFCVYVAAQLARDVSLAALVALEKVPTYFAAAVVPVVIGPLGLIALGVVWGDAPASAYAVVLVGAEMLGCLFAVGGLAGLAPICARQPWQLIPNVLRFGLRAFPGGAAKIVAIRADRIILSALLPPSAYALYALSLSFRDAALLPGNAYGLVLLNTLTERILKSERVGPLLRQALLFNGGVVCIPLLGFTLFGPKAVPALLGPGFAGAVPTMAVIIWSALFLGLSGVFWTWLMAAGYPGRVSAVTIASSVATLALVIPFSAWRGIQGAAAAVVLATAAGLVLASFATRNLSTTAPAAPAARQQGSMAQATWSSEET
jgi:O-antigen/teichoic acid export membrane protein